MSRSHARLLTATAARPAGCGKALLRTDNRDIDAPLVHLERVAADRCDTVHDKERVVLVRQSPDFRGRVLDPGRGLVVHERDDLCARFELLFERREIQRSSPFGRDLVRLPVALADLVEPLAELAVHEAGDLLIPAEV